MTPDFVGFVYLFIKILVLIGLGLYGIFAGVIVRQEQLMEGVLEESFAPILRIIALIHLVSSVGLFLLALIIL